MRSLIEKASAAVEPGTLTSEVQAPAVLGLGFRGSGVLGFGAQGFEGFRASIIVKIRNRESCSATCEMMLAERDYREDV